MSSLRDWFDFTPFSQKLRVMGLLTAFSCLGFYGLVAKPFLVETEDFMREIQELDRQLESYAHVESQFRATKEKVANWEDVVSQQEERLGPQVPMNHIFAEMTAIAQQTGTQITRWKLEDAPPESSTTLVSRHLQLELEGGYHHVAAFLDHIQYLTKILGVTALTMHAVHIDQPTPLIRTTVELLGYEGDAEQSQRLARKDSLFKATREG